MTIEREVVTHSYLEFLKEQIELCPRGPEWNTVLLTRLEKLGPYEDRELLHLTVNGDGGKHFYLHAAPRTFTFVHWEEW